MFLPVGTSSCVEFTSTTTALVWLRMRYLSRQILFWWWRALEPVLQAHWWRCCFHGLIWLVYIFWPTVRTFSLLSRLKCILKSKFINSKKSLKINHKLTRGICPTAGHASVSIYMYLFIYLSSMESHINIFIWFF